MPYLLAADSSTWTGIVVAALTSSALGAVAGGYVTQRLQSRHQREEAWRTRLIDATNDLNTVLVDAYTGVGAWVPAAARGDFPLRTDRGDLTERTSADVQVASDLCRQVQVQLGRVELLVGGESDVYANAHNALRRLYSVINLVRGNSRAQQIVRAVVAERETPGAGTGLLPDAASRGPFLALLDQPEAPSAFDPGDDVNVARWADAAHRSGGHNVHLFVHAARTYIETYRLT